MNYKKKYLKYKLKYLHAKKTFRGGMMLVDFYERLSKVPEAVNLMNEWGVKGPEDLWELDHADIAQLAEHLKIMINLRIIDDQPNDIQISVRILDKIYKTIKKAADLRHRSVQIIFDDELIENDDSSFADHGFEDGVTLSVSYRKFTVEEVATEVARLNPPLTVEELMEDVNVDLENSSQVVGDLDWYNKGITVLPESIGTLTVTGNLYLNGNQLASLPKDFGFLTVEGVLRLDNNRLASLPEGFDSLTVGGSLFLKNNQLASLPEGFGSLTVGRNLHLDNNRLASLPEGFGSLTVGRNLHLGNNQLASLPEGFDSITVGGDVWLRGNMLTEIPDSFENVKGNVFE